MHCCSGKSTCWYVRLWAVLSFLLCPPPPPAFSNTPCLCCAADPQRAYGQRVVFGSLARFQCGVLWWAGQGSVLHTHGAAEGVAAGTGTAACARHCECGGWYLGSRQYFSWGCLCALCSFLVCCATTVLTGFLDCCSGQGCALHTHIGLRKA